MELRFFEWSTARGTFDYCCVAKVLSEAVLVRTCPRVEPRVETTPSGESQGGKREVHASVPALRLQPSAQRSELLFLLFQHD